METEKVLSVVSLILASLITLVFLLDLILGIPFGAVSRLFDILIVVGGAFVIWQAVETYREVA